MAIIDRATIQDQDDSPLGAVDEEVIYQMAVRQGFVADRYDVDGVTVLPARDQTSDALDLMTPEQCQMIRALLAYLDDVGVDTFTKAGGTDGVNFSPRRDADSAEVDICRIVFNRREPVLGSGPYFA